MRRLLVSVLSLRGTAAVLTFLHGTAWTSTVAIAETEPAATSEICEIASEDTGDDDDSAWDFRPNCTLRRASGCQSIAAAKQTLLRCGNGTATFDQCDRGSQGGTDGFLPSCVAPFFGDCDHFIGDSNMVIPPKGPRSKRWPLQVDRYRAARGKAVHGAVIDAVPGWCAPDGLANIDGILSYSTPAHTPNVIVGLGTNACGHTAEELAHTLITICDHVARWSATQGYPTACWILTPPPNLRLGGIFADVQRDVTRLLHEQRPVHVPAFHIIETRDEATRSTKATGVLFDAPDGTHFGLMFRELMAAAVAKAIP